MRGKSKIQTRRARFSANDYKELELSPGRFGTDGPGGRYVSPQTGRFELKPPEIMGTVSDCGEPS